MSIDGARLRLSCEVAAFWRRHPPADKVADDVGVTHDDLHAVLLLLGVGAVDVAAEGCLDASAIFVVLLRGRRRG